MRDHQSRATLIMLSAEYPLSAFYGLNVQIGDIGVPVRDITRIVREVEAGLKLSVPHLFILPQATLPMEDTKHALFCLYATARATPGMGVFLAFVAAKGHYGAGFLANNSGGACSKTLPFLKILRKSVLRLFLEDLKAPWRPHQ